MDISCRHARPQGSSPLSLLNQPVNVWRLPVKKKIGKIGGRLVTGENCTNFRFHVSANGIDGWILVKF